MSASPTLRPAVLYYPTSLSYEARQRLIEQSAERTIRRERWMERSALYRAWVRIQHRFWRERYGGYQPFSWSWQFLTRTHPPLGRVI